MTMNLPPNWSWVKLGDVIKVSSGKGLTSEKMLSTGKYPVYGGNGITGYYDEFLFEDSRLIIGRVGAKCGVLHITKPRSWITDNALIVHLDQSNVLVKYLFYCLAFFDLNKLSVSTAQPVISGSKIYPFQIPLPTLPEQKNIVEKIEELFSGLDSGVASLKKAKAQIRLYRQSVLASAFSGKLVTAAYLNGVQGVKNKNAERLNAIQEITEQGKSEQLPYKQVVPKAAEPKVEYLSSHPEFISGSEKLKQVQLDGKSNQLPAGWKWVNLKDLSSVLGDGLHGTPNYTVDGGYYFINGNNLSDGKVEIKANTKRVTEEEYQKYKKPLNDRTIFVSINGTIGNTAFFNGEKIILGKSACYFNLKDNTDKRYIRYFLKTQRFINYANKTATGSTIKNVSLQAMRELQVPIPPTFQLQTQIIEEIEKRFSEADNLEKAIDESLAKSETLRQSILKQAFEGKLV